MTARSALSDRDLRRRQAASQRAFYRMLATASLDSRLFAREGVQATIVPVRPWFSVFNSVLYEDARSLQATLPILADQYERAGVGAWTVWVPPDDQEARDILKAAAHVCDSTPLLMAAPISGIDLQSQVQLDLLERPTWGDIARCNDRAHGVLEPWSMAPVFERAEDSDSYLYAATYEGSVATALIAREHNGDCYFWFVATAPEWQRRGLASELMRHALRDAQSRGCMTTTLESTKAGEAVYAALGYAALGRFEMWERRSP
jgi:ribosomal protein S18 acetylase RimI-like enzyme